MPRQARAIADGLVYHALNRGNNRATVFHDDDDYRAFVDLLHAAMDRVPMRLLAFCLMPNHFHLALWPTTDDALSRWMGWLTTAHVRRYQSHYGTTGHVWQGRFKAFAIQDDDHLLAVLRYIERNPLRANLVARAEDWPWSSLSSSWPFLDRGPVARPSDWLDLVNQPQTQAELDRLRQSVNRGVPFGNDAWSKQTATALGLEATLRDRGRPKQK